MNLRPTKKKLISGIALIGLSLAIFLVLILVEGPNSFQQLIIDFSVFGIIPQTAAYLFIFLWLVLVYIATCFMENRSFLGKILIAVVYIILLLLLIEQAADILLPKPVFLNLN